MVGSEDVFFHLRELNIVSVTLRLTIAMAFGGVIGLERARKQRAAGFRTYMLVCLGATLTMLLGQYEELMSKTLWMQALQKVDTRIDVSRFGAQVVNGIGFLGAGTIIVTTRQEVQGLTTAAALWASACTGLAIGAGFYEGVILSFITITLCVKVFPILEDLTVAKSRNMNVYLEFERLDDITDIIRHIKGNGMRVLEVDVDRENTRGVHRRPNAILTLQLPSRQSHTLVLADLTGLPCICAIEEI